MVNGHELAALERGPSTKVSKMHEARRRKQASGGRKNDAVVKFILSTGVF
jgi:hypothetical protein